VYDVPDGIYEIGVPAIEILSASNALNMAVPALCVTFVENVAAPVCVKVPELEIDVAVTAFRDAVADVPLWVMFPAVESDPTVVVNRVVDPDV
jgi:hypothetical protein